MENHFFLKYAVILLLAAVLAVPLARRGRLGAVLGYLVAGVLIGPHALNLLGETEGIAALSELGVVLMLFVIGLELSPARLWVMRRTVFGIGTLQLFATALLFGAVAMAMAMRWQSALIIGLGFALSSTAIGLQVLAERKQLQTPHGRSAFGILLLQDVAAIPILALIPLLGTQGAPAESLTWASYLQDAARIIGVLLVVGIGGRYLLRPLFRITARTQIPEVFTAAALLVVMGTGLIVELAGMSMSLGAFVAGMLLADSEYRAAIESRVDPFKGLLLGLFFMSVGMSADISIILHKPWLVAGLVLTLIVVKSGALYAIGRWAAKLDNVQALSLAAVLCQGSEFAFVVFNLQAGTGLISTAQRDLFTVVITLSMALTPLLVAAVARLAERKKPAAAPVWDEIEDEHPKVIIAGFGRVGQIVARVLRAEGIPYTAIDSSIDQIEFSRRFGSKIYYGDPSSFDLLRAARVDAAKVFVIATDDTDANIRTARLVRRVYPDLQVLARVRNRQHAFKLMDMGITDPVRETFHSSLRLTEQVLTALGMAEATVQQRLRTFVEHDAALLRSQHLVYDDETAIMQSARDAVNDLEALFAADQANQNKTDQMQPHQDQQVSGT
ncbi:MAG: monovalent cation:proton antiporter-2 (CPA2) family protein [Dokdonella sp.]